MCDRMQLAWIVAVVAAAVLAAGVTWVLGRYLARRD